MVHRASIGETIYEVISGKALVGGTAHEIKCGKIRLDGVNYGISFGEFVDLGEITTNKVGSMPWAAGGIPLTELPFEDMSLCNTLIVNGERYKVNYSFASNDSYSQIHYYTFEGFNGVTFSEDIPFELQINVSASSINVLLRSYIAGTYNIRLGISN